MKKAVVALIRKGNKVLMGKRRDSNKYTSPGGCVEPKETPWDALVREVKEETGYEVSSYKMVDAMLDDKALVYLYDVEIKGKEDLSKDPDKEFSKLEWVDPNEVPLHHPPDKNVVVRYLNKQ